jgi:hypothetical protein
MSLLGDTTDERRRLRSCAAEAPDTVLLYLVRHDYLRLIRAYEERLLASTMDFLQQVCRARTLQTHV